MLQVYQHLRNTLLSSTDHECTMKYSKEVGQYGQEFSFHPFKIRRTQELILLNFFFFHVMQQRGKKPQIKYVTKCTILTRKMVNRD